MLGPFDTSHQEPFVRRHSSALSEGTGQMARGEPTLPREIFERAIHEQQRPRWPTRIVTCIDDCQAAHVHAPLDKLTILRDNVL